MNAIQIQTTITGETLYLPELKPLVGKAVEITVREIAVPRVTPGADRWSDVVAALEALEDYDFEALGDAGRGHRARFPLIRKSMTLLDALVIIDALRQGLVAA